MCVCTYIYKVYNVRMALLYIRTLPVLPEEVLQFDSFVDCYGSGAFKIAIHAKPLKNKTCAKSLAEVYWRSSIFFIGFVFRSRFIY